MLFNSVQFLVFFPVVTALYFLLPHGWRWALLLAASCVFYMAFIPAYILILAVTIVVDYSAGILIARSAGGTRKLFLAASLVSNVAFLFFFKYFNFVNANLDALASSLDWNYPVAALDIILPIGLSFHTFQAMSYTIEVYRGHQKPEYHPGIFALYVLYYPQLVAGPIERPQNLLHQFYEIHGFDPERVVDGLRQMLWGMFKKVVIADRLAVLVNAVYDHPADYQGQAFLLATVAFAFQIYCDFSGYSDIALGAARVMGFRLMVNFDRPYFARSVSDFWRRWHISLSTWFKDYLYVPLGGNRVGAARQCFNLMVVFLVSGLWHGANWTYVAWGAWHGALLILSLLTAGVRARLVRWVGLTRVPAFHACLRTALTFSLVTVGWVLFRATSLGDAWEILTGMGVGLRELLAGLGHSRPSWHLGAVMVQGRPEFLVTLTLLAVFVALEAGQVLSGDRLRVARLPGWGRWLAYEAAVLGILFLGEFHAHTFIYFQF